jgi:hypothetical protein
MTKDEAQARADRCARLAQETENPNKRRILLQMQQLWSGLAAVADKPGTNIKAEHERLLDIQASLALSIEPPGPSRLH